jgi:hypothetical protein
MVKKATRVEFTGEGEESAPNHAEKGWRTGRRPAVEPRKR